jgi:hypothetical protein
MCKLLCIVDIEDQDKALQFIEEAIKPMTKTDDDGLGLIMMGSEGLGVERWLYPDDFPETSVIPEKLSKYTALLPVNYSSQGSLSQKDIYALGIHSRQATTPKCLENVHPFVRKNTALIHNGMISNHEAFKKYVSTCDSEALLSLYLEHKVKSNLPNIQLVCDEVTGYYAFMVFDPEQKAVTIVKDNRAELSFGHVPGVGTVFCTTPEIIKNTGGKLLKTKIETYPFPSNMVMRWTKDQPMVETLDLEPIVTTTIYYGGKKETKIEDSTKLDEAFCEHKIRSGLYCRECYAKDFLHKDADAKSLAHWEGL